MTDTMPEIVEAFPDNLQIFRRDRKMTFGDHVDHDPNDWQAYIRADAVQAQIDAAVKDERERCAEEAQVNTSPIVAGLMADNAWLRTKLTKAADSLDWAQAHLETFGAVSTVVRYGAREARAAIAATIRKGDQP